MHLYLLNAIIVPFCVFAASKRYLFWRPLEPSVRWRLYVAVILFFISWFLPSFLIDGKDTSFTTHFVGGGMFVAFLWWYIEGSCGLHWLWYWRMAAVYAVVSALGNVNELFELVLVRAHVASILITDTSWDILANTLGSLSMYALLLYVEHMHRAKKLQ